jgi:hypothetical protein
MNLPYGTEFRVLRALREKMSCEVSVIHPSLGVARIDLQNGNCVAASFVVVSRSPEGSTFHYIASSSESIDEEAESIENSILQKLEGT